MFDTDHHARWVHPEAQVDDPERIAIREALAFGKALYDRRTALGLTIEELAERMGMTGDAIECIEEGGTTSTGRMSELQHQFDQAFGRA